jgi:hypothetical protein
MIQKLILFNPIIQIMNIIIKKKDRKVLISNWIKVIKKVIKLTILFIQLMNKEAFNKNKSWLKAKTHNLNLYSLVFFLRKKNKYFRN